MSSSKFIIEKFKIKSKIKNVAEKAHQLLPSI